MNWFQNEENLIIRIRDALDYINRKWLKIDWNDWIQFVNVWQYELFLKYKQQHNYKIIGGSDR